MSTANTRSRHKSRGILFTLFLVLVGAGAALGTVFLLKDVKLPFVGTVEAKTRDEAPPGKVRLPVSAKPLPAFESVDLGGIWDPKEQVFTTQWVSESRVTERGFITNPNEILGRVMARDKKPGYAFTESDFLPKGARASPTAGIEAGMRGLIVNATQIEGLRGLKRGDRFDLVAVRPMRDGGGAPARDTSISPAAAAQQAQARIWNAPTRTLVNNGKVIDPMPTARTGSSNKDEVFLAVSEFEAQDLIEALALDARVICLSRSGLPGAADSSLPEQEAPIAPNVIEVLSGRQSTKTVLPGDAGDSVEPLDTDSARNDPK